MRKGSEDKGSAIDDDSSEESVNIEVEVQEKIKALPTLAEKVQAIAINTYLLEKRELDDKLEKEIERQEIAYRKEMEEAMAKLGAVVRGEVALTAEDMGEGLLTEEERVAASGYFAATPVEDYWKKVLMGHDELGMEVEEVDEPLLSHLVDVSANKSEDLKRLSFVFRFTPNEWFENDLITKEFELDDDGIPTRSWGTPIQWTRNITQKTVTKKNKKKVKKTKTVFVKSFFNFFIDLDDESESEEEGKTDESNKPDISQQFEIATYLYEAIPKSFELFLGIVERSTNDIDGDDDDDDDDDD